MPETQVVFYLVSALAVVFLGISKGGFGSGADFVSMAILSLFLPPGQALGLLLPLLLLMDLVSLRAFWGKWDNRVVGVLLIGAIPGVGLAAMLYRIVDDDLIRVLIGCIALIFVLWRVARNLGVFKRSGRRPPDAVGVVAGVLAGFGSCISHAGGPASLSYQMSLGMEKTAFQASSVLLYWVVNILKLAAYAFLGLLTTELLLADLILLPFAVFGVWLGVRAHYLVSERVFFSLASVLLLGAGTKLIWDGLT